MLHVFGRRCCKKCYRQCCRLVAVNAAGVLHQYCRQCCSESLHHVAPLLQTIRTASCRVVATDVAENQCAITATRCTNVACMLHVCYRKVAGPISATFLNFLQHFRVVAGVFQGTDFVVADNEKVLQIMRGDLLQIIAICCR